MKTNRMRFAKFSLLWVMLMIAVGVDAQKDSSFSVSRNGVVATFPANYNQAVQLIETLNLDANKIKPIMSFLKAE